MSAQGGTISGRAPLHLPIRPIVMLLAAATAAVIGFTAIEIGGQDAREETPAAEFQGSWDATTGHPALRDRPRSDDAVAPSVPMKRTYQEGLGDRGDRVEADSTHVFGGMHRKW